MARRKFPFKCFHGLFSETLKLGVICLWEVSYSLFTDSRAGLVDLGARTNWGEADQALSELAPVRAARPITAARRLEESWPPVGPTNGRERVDGIEPQFSACCFFIFCLLPVFF